MADEQIIAEEKLQIEIAARTMRAASSRLLAHGVDVRLSSWDASRPGNTAMISLQGHLHVEFEASA